MKPKILPLPVPWNSDTAVLHLYHVWSARGRVQLRQITLLNPNMVNALLALWKRDHQQERNTQHDEVASGVLVGIGPWRLLQGPNQPSMIVIKHETDERQEDQRVLPNT